MDKLIRLLHIDKNSLVLDMGCGTGNYTWALMQASERIIGLDISPGMIERARSKYSGLSFVLGDICKLPFVFEIFDGAFAIQVLHHVREREQFFKEAYRVLKKDAIVAIHSCSHRQLRAFWMYRYFPAALKIDLTRIPDSSEIVTFLEKASFSDIGIEVCYQDVVVSKETPENYLDNNYRTSISVFSYLNEEEISSGCQKIREDMASGTIEDFVRESEEQVTCSVGGSCIIYGRKN